MAPHAPLIVPSVLPADAARLGAEVATSPASAPDLLIIGSKIGTRHGVVSISAAGLYLMRAVRCPVLVLPRGVGVDF